MKRVVVTGMGIISPLGNCINDFKTSLFQGKNGIGKISRFDCEDMKISLAAEVKGFNSLDYLTKQEAERCDRYAQMGFAAACQAMDDSKIDGTLAPEKIGVYFGTGIGGIETFSQEAEKLFLKGPRKVSPYFVPKLIANMGAGMIAIRYNCKGAAMPAVTACASGASAIGEAVRAIRHGYLIGAIAGGSEAAITRIGMAGFINMQALSLSNNPEAASLPFDKRRGGFVMGEGGAALILEEYEHAVNRGAKIYGEVCGYGLTCDAYHITAPNPEGVESSRAIAEALREGRYESGESVYINAHGTGTHLNDISETLAIKRAFGEKNAKNLAISSTKSMTGHMLGAAGAAESIVCLLTLNEGIIPPTINLKEADPECDLNYTPGTALKKKVDIAVSNSFGFGGHNVSLVHRLINN